MQARYYDPLVGRFMAVDPVGFRPTNPMSFNRYAYANNNPYKFTDPTGESTCADEECKTSTIDSVITGDDGHTTTVTFINDNPKGASPNQPISTETAKMVETAISDARVQSVNINSTTGGKHDVDSAHPKGRAVDIDQVNGKPVNEANGGATKIQEAARQSGNIRENFGPNIMEKTSVPGRGTSPFTNPGVVARHKNHLHFSGQR